MRVFDRALPLDLFALCSGLVVQGVCCSPARAARGNSRCGSSPEERLETPRYLFPSPGGDSARICFVLFAIPGHSEWGTDLGTEERLHLLAGNPGPDESQAILVLELSASRRSADARLV